MKHAFIILAHDNFRLLSRILRTIDHVDSNIYVHIDNKAIISSEETNIIKQSVINGRLFIASRSNVAWGGYSMIDCEMRMLKYALADQNDYYHFLSGHDYLLVDIDSYLSFFNKHNGKEFVHFAKDLFDNTKNRYSVYHFFQDAAGNDKRKILFWINKVIVKIQIAVGVDRTRDNNLIFKKGSQWCSITRNLAQYLIDNEKLIYRLFKYSYCCDEVFIQTMLANSNKEFRIFGENECNIYGDNLRAIDWARGTPYVYSAFDFDELILSNKLICRKVDTDTEDHKRLLDLLDEYKRRK